MPLLALPEPVVHSVDPRSAPLVRIYDPTGRHGGPWNSQRRFGPLRGSGRFDHHLPPPSLSPNRSVWYASSSLVGAVAEAFGDLGLVDHTCGKRVVLVAVTRPIEVLDLLGLAARRIGLTQEIAGMTDYSTTQAWARAFYDQYRTLKGIRWRGRKSGSVCFVLNDRVDMAGIVPLEDFDIGHRLVWPRIARAARSCSLRLV